MHGPGESLTSMSQGSCEFEMALHEGDAVNKGLDDVIGKIHRLFTGSQSSPQKEKPGTQPRGEAYSAPRGHFPGEEPAWLLGSCCVTLALSPHT